MNELQQLVVSSQANRVKGMLKTFLEDPALVYVMRNLQEAITLLNFISSMDERDFIDAEFEDCPIGKIENKIKELLRESKDAA